MTNDREGKKLKPLPLNDMIVNRGVRDVEKIFSDKVP